MAVEFIAEAENKNIMFTADETFVTHSSPIIFDEFRMGEHYDASKEIDGWNMPGFDDSTWSNAILAEIPRGELKECTAEPVRIVKEITPVKIIRSEKGYIYDFGENNAGVCRLKVKALKGQKIEMYHAEILNGNELDRSSVGFVRPGAGFYEEYNQKDVYIAKGVGEEVYIPAFTYHGFRYVEVIGITNEQATEDLLTYCVMHSDIRHLADFSCSDETVNKLFEMVKRSDESNFYYFPTDCPHREKNGWTGDASFSADHLALLYDVSASWHEWLNNIRKAQGDDGRLPGFVPNYNTAYDWGNGPAWDSVIFNLPYQLYKLRGDMEIIKENAHSMMRYLEYVTSQRNDDGTIAFGLGDFMPVGTRRNTDYTTPLVLVISITVMDIARKAAEMFNAVGYYHNAEYAEGIYKDMRNTIRKNLVDTETMETTGKLQSGQAMAIYYGVFDENEKKQAFENLLRYIRENDGNFDCGIIGMHTLFHVLSEFGESELAYHMITKREYPSYGHFIDNGETTLTESFKPDGVPCGSHNHHFFGDIARWFINSIAGLVVESCDRIIVKPNFISSLQFASANCELPGGKVSVSWKRTENGIELGISCDESIKYDIELPREYVMKNGKIIKESTYDR